MINTVKTELMFYDNLNFGKEKNIQIMLDNNNKLYAMYSLYKRKTHKNFYNALLDASNDDVKQLIPIFIKFSDANKSLNILNMYSSMIDLDEVFDKYLYLIDCFREQHVYCFKEICEYMIGNKINMNKYINRIIAICMKNQYTMNNFTQIHDIKGIELTPEQEEYYNRYVASKDDTFERIIGICIPYTYTSFCRSYALVNCKYDAIVDENIYNAYKNKDIVYINKHKHVPNFECIVCSFSSYKLLDRKKYTYTPDINMDTVDRLCKLNVHELTVKNINYDLNGCIKMNDILTGFSGELNLEYDDDDGMCTLKEYDDNMCTLKEYIEKCCVEHYDNKFSIYSCIKYNCDDIMKYHYVQNTPFINIFTRLNKYDVFINFGNLVYYILDNYS